MAVRVRTLARCTLSSTARSAGDKAAAANLRFDSLCVKEEPVHAGAWRAVSTPIVATSTYEFASVEHGARLCSHPDTPFASEDGYVYSRWNNPTCDAVAKSIARLENVDTSAGGGSRLFATGMAAITTSILASVKQVSYPVCCLRE